ncbi:TetR/AcrR family transcriptional regulator [Solicola gregarius]|uniref:TetR/AcrR family transcriptional regulator n=1 Tax=Solicola gregarius TaxID=2908642 RepID=A0AA46YL79_9ACTN|nr:TetR/AcrR family transcriptional regulator [Solicola gregarius]UYM06630.1 TetR/AcrR family transcriptional regulator [Solicola gregarius]
MTKADEGAVVGRTAQKREAVLSAATTLFLRNGFRGTSMDEIASVAAVSKQTVYKQFADKEALFCEIVEGVTGNAHDVIDTLAAAFGDTLAATRDELEKRLRAVAHVYLDAVLRTQVLSLRRLIIAEAERFPDLARRYYEQAPARGIDVIADRLRPYADADMVVADDLRLAAAHFAYLALSIAQDRALFLPAELPTADERRRLAAAAARAFLAAYGSTEPDVDEP